LDFTFGEIPQLPLKKVPRTILSNSFRISFSFIMNFEGPTIGFTAHAIEFCISADSVFSIK